MLGRLTSILHHAAEVTTQVLAPSVSRADEFLSHVKTITQLFVDEISSNSSSDVSVVDTTIPSHLDHMLFLLCDEDSEADGGMGPCMELMLHRKVMTNLQDMAEVDIPNGVRETVLNFCAALIGQIRHPILAQVSIHEPLQRLVSFCGNSPKTAIAELQLLKTLVLKFKKDAFNADFFFMNRGDNRVFIVLEALVKLAHSKESLVCFKALETIQSCCSLQDKSVAESIAKHSQLLDYMVNRLQLHYKVIPTGVLSKNVLQCQAEWGIDYPIHLFDSKSPPEKHYLPGMFAWLDYYNHVATIAHSSLREPLCQSFRDHFLETCIKGNLTNSTEDCQVKALLILAKGLHYITCKELQLTIVDYLVGSHGDHPIRKVLIAFVDHLSEDICYATLHLFDAILSIPEATIIAKFTDINIVKSADRSKRREWALEREKVEDLVTQYMGIPPKWLATSYQVHETYCHKSYMQEAYTLLAGYGDLVYLWDEMDCQIKVEDFSSAPLISALLKKTERLLDQPYDINLILSSVLMRVVACLPTSLEDMLLGCHDNKDNSQTLQTALIKVCKELQSYSEASITLKLNVIEARRRLEGKETSDLLSMPHNNLVEGAVVFEEFCKEIACLLFAKRSLILLTTCQ